VARTACGLGTVLGLAALFVVRSGHADEARDRERSNPDRPRHHDQGFEPSVYVGVGGYADHLRFSGAPWASGKLEPSVGVHADLAYRIVSVFDLGLHVFHQWIAAENVEENVEVRTTAPGAGLLARVHPLAVLAPRLPLDVALGTGFDVSAAARQKKETTTPGGKIEQHSAVTGFAVPFWLSFDVFVTNRVALGVLGMWAPWFRVEECRYEGTSGLTTQCKREPTASDRYLFLGLGARVHLEFVK
jgi:hypothetical protein